MQYGGADHAKSQVCASEKRRVQSGTVPDPEWIVFPLHLRTRLRPFSWVRFLTCVHVTRTPTLSTCGCYLVTLNESARPELKIQPSCLMSLGLTGTVPVQVMAKANLPFNAPQ